jgi:hypothetical protein
MFESIMNNMFIKLVIAVAFFWFVYKILFEIGMFFGLDQNVLGMYYIWIGILVVLLTILPPSKSKLLSTFDTILKTGESELAPKAKIVQVVENAFKPQAPPDAPNAAKAPNAPKAAEPKVEKT